MEFNNLKKEAIELAKKGRFKDFFQKIEPLNAKEWCACLFPKEKREKFTYKKDFWKEIIHSNHFLLSLSSDKKTYLLDTYFKDSRNANSAFNKAIIKTDALLFIEEFKSSRAIFKEGFIKSIQFLKQSENEELKKHAEFWQFLHQQEKQLWNQFKKNIKIWLDLHLVALFSYCCNFLAFRNDEYSPNFINVLLTYYFFKNKDKHIKLNYDNIQEYALNILVECTQNRQNQYFKSLSHLLEWYYFVENGVYCYTHYDNYFLSETKHHFHLNCKNAIQEAKWKTVGNKIELLPLAVEMNYDDHAELIFEKEGIQIPGDTKNMQEINKDFSIRNLALTILLDAMQFSIYRVDNVDVPIFDVANILNGFIENAKQRYFIPLTLFKEKNPQIDTLKSIFHVAKKQILKRQYPEIPLRIDTQKEFESIVTNNSHYSEENYSKEIKKIICFSPKEYPYPKYFDRFSPFVKLEATPFFEIDDCIISFQNWVGKLGNSFKTISLNTHYHYKKRFNELRPFRPYKLVRQEDKNFEKYFKEELFKDYDFEIIKNSVDVWDANKRMGEIDILIFHQEILMLIELKRTHFRTSLTETNYEANKVHQKAATQLNKILAFLNQKENHEKIKADLGIDMNKVKKILPLIISTSLEQDGEMIHGILKQNFFQFNFHATYFNRKLDNILQEFYDVLKNDSFWDCFDALCSHPREFPKDPINLRMSFPKSHKTKVLDDENEFYHYQKGNEYYRAKDFNIAIQHYEKAKQINPIEATYLRQIANCLRKMGQKDLSIQVYKEMLMLYNKYRHNKKEDKQKRKEINENTERLIIDLVSKL